MRIFQNPCEAYNELKRDLKEMGLNVPSASVQDIIIKGDVDSYDMKELTGYCYQLSPLKDATMEAMKLVQENDGNLEWLQDDFHERVNFAHINPGNAWRLRASTWEPFLHGERFSYTYNDRFREQIPKIIDELKRHPTSRQCVMTMYDRHQDLDNLGGIQRVPCSLSYQFLIREEKLHMIYHMRSCDANEHLIYDMALTIMLQDYIAEILYLKTGTFTHFFGSLHGFRKDMEDIF